MEKMVGHQKQQQKGQGGLLLRTDRSTNNNNSSTTPGNHGNHPNHGWFLIQCIIHTFLWESVPESVPEEEPRDDYPLKIQGLSAAQAFRKWLKTEEEEGVVRLIDEDPAHLWTLDSRQKTCASQIREWERRWKGKRREGIVQEGGIVEEILE